MKTSLNHLPEQKQQEIMAIADALCKLAEPEMIILFGSYARGTYVEHRYEAGDITYEYISDFDILVVVENEKKATLKESRIVEQLRKNLHHDLQVQVIVHGMDYFNDELEDGQYFFSDIVKEGVLLFDSGKFKIKNPKVKTAAERAKTSQMYFDKWFTKGADFYFTSEIIFKENRLAISIFNLHQAAEALFTCIELVYTHYKPKTHDLRRLNKLACVHDDRFKQAFPLHTTEQKTYFDKLVRAYIDSRYKLNYEISVEEMQYLLPCVERLEALTEIICKEKIEEIANG
jgi:predicted nucleotidyltransferase/HEPN domain-containing protein